MFSSSNSVTNTSKPIQRCAPMGHERPSTPSAAAHVPFPNAHACSAAVHDRHAHINEDGGHRPSGCGAAQLPLLKPHSVKEQLPHTPPSAGDADATVCPKYHTSNENSKKCGERRRGPGGIAPLRQSCWAAQKVSLALFLERKKYLTSENNSRAMIRKAYHYSCEVKRKRGKTCSHDFSS